MQIEKKKREGEREGEKRKEEKFPKRTVILQDTILAECTEELQRGDSAAVNCLRRAACAAHHPRRQRGRRVHRHNTLFSASLCRAHLAGCLGLLGAWARDGRGAELRAIPTRAAVKSIEADIMKLKQGVRSGLNRVGETRKVRTIGRSQNIDKLE